MSRMFIYDGFNLSPYLLVRDIGKPLMPPQRINSMRILGRHGAYFLEKTHDPVVIPVDVMIHEDLDMSYAEMKRFLAGKLNKKEPKPIIFPDEPDRFIGGIISDTTDIRNLIEAGETILYFYCPDPYYYAIEDEVFSFSGVGAFNFTREKGNEESEPIIEIRGANSGGEIILSADNTEMVFDGVLNKGETLVLDSKLVTSYIVQADGEKRSANDDLSTMEFPILEVGANQLSISVKGVAEVEETTVYARSRWI